MSRISLAAFMHSAKPAVDQTIKLQARALHSLQGKAHVPDWISMTYAISCRGVNAASSQPSQTAQNSTSHQLTAWPLTPPSPKRSALLPPGPHAVLLNPIV